MMFLIGSDGIIQHASNDEWIDFSDLFGNPSSLKKGTWTRSLPHLVKASIDSGFFRSPRKEAAAIADWNILKKQVVLYQAMEMLLTKFVTEKRMPCVISDTNPNPIIPSINLPPTPTQDTIINNTNTISTMNNIHTSDHNSKTPTDTTVKLHNSDIINNNSEESTFNNT